ncbi:MAG: SGNH/GDSL hydrolase family protein [Bryobacteraceae bacterium]
MAKFPLTNCAISALALLSIPAFAGNEKNYTYLALGDSVSFGYDPTVTSPTPDKFVGYPEAVAAIKKLLKSKKLANASCPGQSSASFLIGGFDNGCEDFKRTIGLHTDYSGTQASFAVSQLLGNKHIDLVTLSIGGNDLLLLQKQCEGQPDFPACVEAGLPAVLNLYGQNLTQILSTLRGSGKYDRTLVLLKYFSPSADPLFLKAIAALNQVMTQVGTQFGVHFADGFAAFYFASIPSGGDPCAAGLLVRLSPTVCDVHPSPKGRDLLAAAVLLTLQNVDDDDDDDDDDDRR